MTHPTTPYEDDEPWVCDRPSCTLSADEHDLAMVLEHTYDLPEGSAVAAAERVLDKVEPIASALGFTVEDMRSSDREARP